MRSIEPPRRSNVPTIRPPVFVTPSLWTSREEKSCRKDQSLSSHGRCSLLWSSLLTISEAMKLETGPAGRLSPRPTALRWSSELSVCGDYSSDVGGDRFPILVHAPFAGHDAVIADFHARQSLMGCLRLHAGGPLYLTDWKPADSVTQSFGIDEYLAEVAIAIDELGGRVHLVGAVPGRMGVRHCSRRASQARSRASSWPVRHSTSTPARASSNVRCLSSRRTPSHGSSR